MIFYVTVGGMKGTTWVQIVKAVLLMTGHRADHGAGARRVQLQPVRPARRRGRQHRQGRRVPRARPEVRRIDDEQDRLRQPGAGSRARYGGPAAHPDPVLHRPDVEGRADIGQLGDRPHRVLLPDDAGARLRCCCAARHRTGERGRDVCRQPGLTTTGRGGRRRSRDIRRRDPAGVHRRRGVRDHPRGRRRTHADLGVVGGARPLRQRGQEGRGVREGRGAGRARSPRS